MLVPVPVREVMQSPVVTVEPDESARTAATRLVDETPDVGS
jgi:CBS domain-containing protein